MAHHHITFPNTGKTIAVPEGASLLHVMAEAGLAVEAPCGGNGACGKCRVLIDGSEALACRTIVNRDMTVIIPETGASSILDHGAGREILPDGTDDFVLAIDIGTTTLVAYLLNGKTGKTIAKRSAVNPQNRFGADVISRIQHAVQPGGSALQTAILEGLSGLIAEICRDAAIDPVQITKTAIAGNTAMHHLLLGIDPKPLVTPPYMPAIFHSMVLPAADMLPVSGEIRVLPNIAGFVGGDTVGCLLAAEFDQIEPLTLMIDIGTNGEMVLGSRHRRIACSTAAGPAFEGAKIACGMRGISGAIDHVWLEDGVVCWHTIDNAAPVGLCGSGLLDLVAVLLETGVIDESGRMSVDKYFIEGTNVCLSGKDVQEVQLAKAAIYAGIRLMARKMDVAPEDIRQVYLAGAFGNYMNPASACRIGMIPACLGNRIISIGNAAGEGAKLCALSAAEFERAARLAEETEFLELASCADFQDCYIDALELTEDPEIEL